VIQVRRALLSVYHKEGLVDFARQLVSFDIELLASGGTARALQEAGLPVTPIERLTGLGELFGGRLKTLTPQVHGGLLLRRDVEADCREAAEHGIAPIDLLCVDLYPFAETAAAGAAAADQAIEMIDIGGPAMVRAAAKNHRDVVVVSRREQFAHVAALLGAHGGAVPRVEAARLAVAAFARTAAYDAEIFHYLRGRGDAGDTWPPHWATGGEMLSSLRYGENPHQRAAWFAAPHGFWSAVKQHQGKEVSYNNLADVWAGWSAVRDFDECACVVIKHRTPSGLALGPTPGKAFALARDGDPLSAFGGVVVFNRRVDADAATPLADMFLEVVAAPDWSGDALARLRKKKNVRVLTLPPAERLHGRDAYFGLGDATLVQEPLPRPHAPAAWQCVTQQDVDEGTRTELFFAWRVVRHVRSNAIALTRDARTLGLGGGQTSRIDACDVALLKAARAGHDVSGAVLASDAFFPFRDVVDRAAAAGVRALVQPGGSRRDQDSIDACNQHGLAMLFTGERAFVH